MANVYYTCNLAPVSLFVRVGYTPRWLGHFLPEGSAANRRDALSVHPMTCPYVTGLVAAADKLLSQAGEGDCLVVPGGCDAMRRLGDLLAAFYPGKVFVLPLPRSGTPATAQTLARDLARLEDWLRARAAQSSDLREPDLPEPPAEYPASPQPGGVFVVAGPLSDNSLLRLILDLGARVSGLESCTGPNRWRPLWEAKADSPAELAQALLEIGICPRRSTIERRDHLVRRLDETRPSSIIYARQSFCDPGAYDALLVAQLAKERGLPYLEIEVGFPFEASGPLRTRVEAFLEAQLLDEDLLGDDLFANDELLEEVDSFENDLFAEDLAAKSDPVSPQPSE